ncbi:hypothetical protein [Streptococcus parauberis]|uniref:hypothetical protein n=1 Tax=Streptococcus parauberis TaxID=1348 RepID=UPI0039AFE955
MKISYKRSLFVLFAVLIILELIQLGLNITNASNDKEPVRISQVEHFKAALETPDSNKNLGYMSLKEIDDYCNKFQAKNNEPVEKVIVAKGTHPRYQSNSLYKILIYYNQSVIK